MKLFEFEIKNENLLNLIKQYQPYLHRIDFVSFKLGLVFGLLLIYDKIEIKQFHDLKISLF